MGGNGVLLFVGHEWTQSVFAWWDKSEKEGQCSVILRVCVCLCSLRMIQMNVCTVEWTWRHGGQACGCGVGKERGTDGECQIDSCT